MESTARFNSEISGVKSTVERIEFVRKVGAVIYTATFVLVIHGFSFGYILTIFFGSIISIQKFIYSVTVSVSSETLQ